MVKEGQQESAAADGTKPKAPVTYQMSEQPSSKVQEEEFAKQSRIARYLAAGLAAIAAGARPLGSRERLERGPLQRERLKQPPKNLGRKNWRRRGGERGR